MSMERNDAEQLWAEIEALPQAGLDALPPEARNRVQMMALVKRLGLDPATVTWAELKTALAERAKREEN